MAFMGAPSLVFEPPAAVDHTIETPNDHQTRCQTVRARGTMAFAASVGEAILLQFQAYARHALVSGD